MRIALLQMNSTLGDFQGNAEKIRVLAKTAKEHGAVLAFTPEKALCGYPPMDLVKDERFFSEQEKALATIAEDPELRGLTLVVGHALKDGEDIYTAAAILDEGGVTRVCRELSCPGDALPDDRRARDFRPRDEEGGPVIEVDGARVGLLIGSEIWNPEPMRQFRFKSIDFAVSLNAARYYLGAAEDRQAQVRARVEETGTPVAYLNGVGGQDRWVFDGASFVINFNRQIGMRASFCKEELVILEWDGKTLDGAIQEPEPSEERAIWRVAGLGLKDYVRKSGFEKVCLGLSGGLDSALVMAMAVEVLGPENVEVLMLPGPYTRPVSNSSAQKMCETLGVRGSTIPIAPMFDAIKAGLAERFEGLPEDVTEENIQSRIRGLLLMALSNKTGAMLLNTGNKSEAAVGYCTLYGDTNGGYAPLQDIYKTVLYKVARTINEDAGREIIPVEIIERAPSAELRADQTDQDSLPPYEILDAILEDRLRDNLSRDKMIEKGRDPAQVDRVLHLLRTSEYKRSQSPIGPKLYRDSFGSERRMPLANAFKG